MGKSTKQWQVELGPRERLLSQGIAALTDSELLALLLGAGTQNKDVLLLAQELLTHLGGLPQLARARTEELMQITGIGEAKAMAIQAAFELARRRQVAEHREIDFRDSASVAAYMSPRLLDLYHEAFYVLYLNRSNQLISEQLVGQGGISATTVDPKVVFKEALRHTASALILCHNHPSGNLQPSDEDRALTLKLQQAAQLLDMQVLDHLILSHKGYYSFADNGLI